MREVAVLAERLGFRDGVALVECVAESLWHFDERGRWPGSDEEESECYRGQAAYVLVGLWAAER